MRPDNAYTRSPGVTPGLHRPEAGSHEVVWRDPSILQLDARETMGLRQSELLKADDRKERSERGIREYEAWKARREEIIAAGSIRRSGLRPRRSCRLRPALSTCWKRRGSRSSARRASPIALAVSALARWSIRFSRKSLWMRRMRLSLPRPLLWPLV